MPSTVNHFSPQSKTQCAAILRLLLDAHGAWVPLPEIMACAAQYNARLWTLRHRMRFNIENRTEIVEGVRHSWFRLVSSPAVPALDPVEEKTTLADSAASKSGDWYEQQTGKPRSSSEVSPLPLFSGVR